MWRTNFDVFDESEVLNREKKENSQCCDYKEVNNSPFTIDTCEQTSPPSFPFERTRISTPKQNVSCFFVF